MRHFQVYELVDEETYERMGEAAISLFAPEALEALDGLRDYFDLPIVVNNWHAGGSWQWRGWRTPEKAKELGAPHSQHALGRAFDCTIHGIPAEEARARILGDKDHHLLCRITRLEEAVAWVHFDTMPVADRIHLFRA